MGLGDIFYNVSRCAAPIGSTALPGPASLASLLLPQTFVKRNSVYVATIIIGAFVGEKVGSIAGRRWAPALCRSASALLPAACNSLLEPCHTLRCPVGGAQHR